MIPALIRPRADSFSFRTIITSFVFFLSVLALTSGFLWFSHQLSLVQQIGGAAGIVALLWLIGTLCEPRPVAAPATRLQP